MNIEISIKFLETSPWALHIKDRCFIHEHYNGINLNVNINLQIKSESSLLLEVHIYKAFIIILT